MAPRRAEAEATVVEILGGLMQYEFAYEITDELMRLGTRRFMAAHFRWPVLVLFALYFALLVPFCMMNRWHFLCGVLFGAILVLLMMLVIAWLMRNRTASQAARRYPSPAARCTIGEDGIRLENSLATSQLTWKAFQEVVRAPDVWLLLMTRQHYFVLPAGPLAGDPGRFLAAQVAAAGGRVR